jgi:hypothetical protein
MGWEISFTLSFPSFSYKHLTYRVYALSPLPRHAMPRGGVAVLGSDGLKRLCERSQ